MTRIVYFFCDFLYTAVRIWGVWYLIRTISTPRKKQERIIWGILIFIIAGLDTYNHSVISVLFSNSFMVIIILLLTVLGGITYKIRFFDSFGVVYFLWIGSVLADFLFQTYANIFLSDLNLPNTVFLETTIYRGIYLILCSVVFIFVMRILSRFIKKYSNDLKKYSKWCNFFMPILGFYMVYFQRVYKLLVSEQIKRQWIIFLISLSFIVLVFVWNYIFWKEREKNRILCLERDLLQNDYARMISLYENKKIVLHDIKKHLQVIREMAEAGKKQEMLLYLDQLGGKVQTGFNRNITNHGLLNLILTQKIQEAENSKISIHYNLDDMSGLLLEPTEICALFSNILDNAIEANCKNDIEEKRWIKMTCNKKEEKLVVYISNPMVEKKLLFRGEIPQTTKPNKWMHGIGLKSVMQIVNLHDGHMLIETNDGIFTLTICLNGF